MLDRVHPDLAEHIFQDASLGTCLHHPLVIAFSLDTSRWEDVNRRYVTKRDEVARALSARDWNGFVFLHERPYRTQALRQLVNHGLADAEYWALVGKVWIDSENIHQDHAIWRKIWQSPMVGRHNTMSDVEQLELAKIDESTRVWRGTRYRRSATGLSWTSDRDVAIWFGRRSARLASPVLLASGVVSRKDVLALFLGRGEHEFVCRKVEKLAIEELTG